MNPTTGGDPPPQPTGASVTPSTDKLNEMNQSAEKSASPVTGSVVKCPKKTSWFAIRVLDKEDGDKVVEGFTIKLDITGEGQMDRVTSKGADPIKIPDLLPGGKGEVKSIDCGDLVWEAVGDIS